MRLVFLDAFHGKCAYCEAKVIVDQGMGDVEHYRPKGAVTDDANRPLMITPAGGGPPQPHPGYPWLAYDWHNLLPSCIACNQARPTRAGTTVGKWNRFPVRGFRALKPGDEKAEKPDLLHPLLDYPTRHLRYVVDTGELIGRTRRGRETIRILNLNREGLPEQRMFVFNSVRAMVFMANAPDVPIGVARQLVTHLTDFARGVSEYSLAGRAALASIRRAT